MKVTIDTVVSTEIAERFWSLYDQAFEPLRTASPCRQYMREHEFKEEMNDERMLKFVLWDESDNALGMALVATDLYAVDWISPDYFKRRFPEHFKRGLVYYFGALLVEPSSQGMKYSKMLLQELVNFVIRNNGIAAYDCYSGNNQWMPDLIARMTEEQGFLKTHELEPQYYYAFESKGFKPGHGPSSFTWGFE